MPFYITEHSCNMWNYIKKWFVNEAIRQYMYLHHIWVIIFFNRLMQHCTVQQFIIGIRIFILLINSFNFFYHALLRISSRHIFFNFSFLSFCLLFILHTLCFTRFPRNLFFQTNSIQYVWTMCHKIFTLTFPMALSLAFVCLRNFQYF